MKVLDNPVMNQESRNQTGIGCTDGVPYFKDMIRGCWPIIWKNGNLPSALANLMQNCHIVSIQGSEFLSLSEDGKYLLKSVRAPKSLNPVLEIIARHVHRLYHEGTRIIDTSEAPDSPNRVFVCRFCVLFWCGDYPGQGLASGFTHKGKKFCHWCETEAWWDPATNRNQCDDYRRDLGTNSISM